MKEVTCGDVSENDEVSLDTSAALPPLKEDFFNEQTNSSAYVENGGEVVEFRPREGRPSGFNVDC